MLIFLLYFIFENVLLFNCFVKIMFLNLSHIYISNIRYIHVSLKHAKNQSKNKFFCLFDV